jgi:hypothetical protein
MASTSASSRPSDTKRKKNLKPELEREAKNCDFSYFSDLECESESISDTSESFVRILRCFMVAKGWCWRCRA